MFLQFVCFIVTLYQQTVKNELVLMFYSSKCPASPRHPISAKKERNIQHDIKTLKIYRG